MDRMHYRNHGRYVAIQLTEGVGLIDAAQKGATAARLARATLETSTRPAERTEIPMQTSAGRFASQEFEPAAGHSGLGLT
jgi:hypothetical protein